MKIFAISDLHLSFSSDKPMDVFGEVWDGHYEQIEKDWNNRVADDDLVIVAGDISWAMSLENAKIDLAFFKRLKGKKVIVKGNHDYWWSSLKKVNEAVPENVLCLQNNAFRVGCAVLCGTRGWVVQEEGKMLLDEDKKIYEREVLRLELSLNEAKKIREEGDKLIAVMHYPPFNTTAADSGFTDLLKEAKADFVIYGHLHGRRKGFRMEWVKDGATYFLTSCDMLNNKLLEVCELP